MATFVSSTIYLLQDNGDGTYTVTGGNPDLTYTSTDNDATSPTFDVGESIDAESGGTVIGSLTYLGTTGSAWVGLSPDNGFYYVFGNEVLAAGDIISLAEEPMVVCFLPGTAIATPDGQAAIETLRAGDLVLTSGGEAKPVRWLARQTVSRVFADPLRVLPIRIQAGALGESLPERDLFVSPDHALLIEGVLIQAGALVNGTTITRHSDVPQSFVYYHVELEDHALILTEGVAAETFVDNVTRARFDNWREAPEALPIAEMSYPRAKAWRQVPERVRLLLAARAETLGFAEQAAA